MPRPPPHKPPPANLLKYTSIRDLPVPSGLFRLLQIPMSSYRLDRKGVRQGNQRRARGKFAVVLFFKRRQLRGLTSIFL